MKYVRLAVISFVVFFLLITAFSLLIPNRVRISRVADFFVTKEKLMEQLTHVGNWKKWYPGADSAQLLLVYGQPQGLLPGNNLKNALLITDRTDSSVTATVADKTIAVWNVMQNDTGHVSLQWYMDIKLRWYPWEKFSSLLFDKRYGSMMEQGLQNLKKLLQE